MPSFSPKRARDQLEKIDVASEAVYSSEENRLLLLEIGRIVFSIKKGFDRRGKGGES